MNWEGFEMNRTGPNSRYYPSSRLNTTRNLRVVGDLVDVGTEQKVDSVQWNGLLI
jgi:hypothetical protein